MLTWKLELSEIELACGVTLAAVAEQLPRVLVRNGVVTVPGGLSPALARAVARTALGSDTAEYLGHNELGLANYSL